MNKRILLILLFALFPLPAAAATSTEAYQFMRQGIFDCNLNGAYAMSVGAMSATGGVYVPVADATVELNTGILVYKECVLREVVDRESEAAGASLTKKAYIGIRTGRNGQPLYVQKPAEELLTQASDPAVLAALEGPAFQSLNPALKQAVTNYIIRKYSTDTRKSEETLGCSFQGDLRAFQKGTLPFNFNDFLIGTQPQCDPVFAGYLTEDYVNRRIAVAIDSQRQQWEWGRGFYSVTDNSVDPLNRVILTPSSNVQQSFQTILDSSIRRLESANDIGQMINSLYAGLSTQIISDGRGLAGLAETTTGQLSYLDKLVAESNAGLRNAATNAALQILNASRQVEANYLQAWNGVASTLATAINQLRGAESQCFDLIAYKDDGHSEWHVCTQAPSGTKTCTDKDGNSIKIATSTVFSQAIVDSQIKSHGDDALVNIGKSQTALASIENLIRDVTNDSSQTAQRDALQRLDELVATRALHTPQDLTDAQQKLASIQTLMTAPSTGLVATTIASWADGIPNGQPFSATNPTGWCNVHQASVVTYWAAKWKQ